MITAVIGHRNWALTKAIGDGESARQTLCAKIQNSIRGSSHIIIDAAWGTGLLAGWAAVMEQIPFTVCEAFPGCSAKWPTLPKNEFIELCKRAAHVLTIDDQEDCPASYMTHFEWMIKNCNRLVAVHDGSTGKTQDALHFAGAMGAPVSIIDPRE